MSPGEGRAGLPGGDSPSEPSAARGRRRAAGSCAPAAPLTGAAILPASGPRGGRGSVRAGSGGRAAASGQWVRRAASACPAPGGREGRESSVQGSGRERAPSGTRWADGRAARAWAGARSGGATRGFSGPAGVGRGSALGFRVSPRSSVPAQGPAKCFVKGSYRELFSGESSSENV